MTSYIAATVVLMVLLAGVVIYNGLIQLRRQADNAWADIDVQLKRRHDLIPNLVQAVKGYMGFEQTTLEQVVEARSAAMAAQGTQSRGEAEGRLTQLLRGFFVVAEDYPELRASEQVLSLQKSLVEVEDTLQNARRYYNAVVRDYNTRVEQVPANMIALLFQFKPREYFQIAALETAVPQIEV